MSKKVSQLFENLDMTQERLEDTDMEKTGVSLRDYLAAKAMHCLLTGFDEDNRQRSIELNKVRSDMLRGKYDINLDDCGCPFDETWRTGIAMDAYLMADVMLKVREVDLSHRLKRIYRDEQK